MSISVCLFLSRLNRKYEVPLAKLANSLAEKEQSENLIYLLETVKQFEYHSSILSVYVEQGLNQLDSAKCLFSFSYLKNNVEQVQSIKFLEGPVKALENCQEAVLNKLRTILTEKLSKRSPDAVNLLNFYVSFGALSDEIRQLINKALENLVKRKFYSEFICSILKQINNFDEVTTKEMRHVLTGIFDEISSVSGHFFYLGQLLRFNYYESGERLEDIMEENGYPDIFSLFIGQLKKSIEHIFKLMRQPKNAKQYEYFLNDYEAVTKLIKKYCLDFSIKDWEITSFKEDFTKRFSANFLESVDSAVHFITKGDNDKLTVRYVVGYFGKLSKLLIPDVAPIVQDTVSNVILNKLPENKPLLSKTLYELLALIVQVRSSEVERNINEHLTAKILEKSRVAYMKKDKGFEEEIEEWRITVEKEVSTLVEGNEVLINCVVAKVRSWTVRFRQLFSYVIGSGQLEGYREKLEEKGWIRAVEGGLVNYLHEKKMKIDQFLIEGCRMVGENLV